MSELVMVLVVAEGWQIHLPYLEICIPREMNYWRLLA